jgi:hypothetical protein
MCWLPIFLLLAFHATFLPLNLSNYEPKQSPRQHYTSEFTLWHDLIIFFSYMSIIIFNTHATYTSNHGRANIQSQNKNY